jgi:hypothetical protein
LSLPTHLRFSFAEAFPFFSTFVPTSFNSHKVCSCSPPPFPSLVNMELTRSRRRTTMSFAKYLLPALAATQLAFASDCEQYPGRIGYRDGMG